MSGRKKTPPKTREDAKETERLEEDVQIIEVKTVDEEVEDKGAEGEETTESQPESPEEEIARLIREKQERHERLLRVQADFDNYRKRVQKEQGNLLRYGAENALREILPVVDNIELAVDSARTHDNSSEQLREGIEMIRDQFLGALERLGVKPIEALDQPFDPNKHEALLRVHAPETEEGAVVGEIRKGYYLHDKVLRPAQVTVGTHEQEKPAGQAPEDTPEESAEEPQESSNAQ